jgi:glucose/mannose transport system substrate-binding protein
MRSTDPGLQNIARRRLSTAARRRVRACAALILVAVVIPRMIPGAQAQPLNVLHWWTSDSERQAADRLVQQLAAQGVEWHDDAIPGGGGGAAIKVLTGRVLAGEAPDVAQVIGRTLTEWADLDLVLPLDAVAERGHWRQTMFPVVLQTISRRGKVMAAPLGVHRINTLLVNHHVLEQLRLAPPRTWADVDAAARAMRAHHITPLAWSDEPWQVATVFETVLLSEGGPALYAELASSQGWPAWQDARVVAALKRLRWLRDLDDEASTEQPWTASARQLQSGAAGMLIMGDWARGELEAWGEQPGLDFDCVPIPQTAGMHLYSIDTLAMLVGRNAHRAQQEKMAEVLAQPATQLAYNQAKGSVPARTDIDPSQLDVCARDSWQTLARPGSALLPSIAHRMAAVESVRDAIGAVLQRFVRVRGMTPQHAQAQLLAIVRGAAQ